MGLKHIAISAAAVTAMVCAYADVEWKIYADGYPNEYGVVSRNRERPYSGDVVVPSEWVVDGKTIPVRKVTTYAFTDAKALTSVVFPDSVTEIGESAFSGCSLLSSVEFGRSVDVIASTVFDGCTSLVSVKFAGAKPTQVNEYAFAYRKLTVYYPANGEGWDDNDPYWGGATLLTYVPYDPNAPESVAALNELIAQSPDGEEVTLKLSSTGSFDSPAADVVVPSGKRIVLDLNGKVLACKSIEVAGSLTVNDGSSPQVGRIVGDFALGTGGTVAYNANRSWTVNTAAGIRNAILLNGQGAGIAVTLDAAVDAGELEIPAGVSQSLDLNGKVMIVSPLYVYGSLTVTDSSAGKTGWIDGLVNAKEEGGTLSFETVRTVSNRSDLDQVLLINQQGAKVSARLARNLSTNELTIPAGESLSLDLNGKLLTCSPLVVNGTLTVDDSTGGGAVCVPSYPSIGTEGKLDFKGGGLRGTFTAIAPSGGIAPAEAETVEVRDGKLRLGVKVERTDSLADPDWRPVAKESVGVADDGTVEITVPANAPSGFYRLQSKGQ